MTVSHLTPIAQENQKMTPLLMGVLNVSPDSFFQDSIALSQDALTNKITAMIEAEVDLIDLGGEATSMARFPDKSVYRDSDRVTEEEELNRVLPAIEIIRPRFSGRLSIDTMRPVVAREAVKRGVSLINDQTGFRQIEMAEVAVETGVEVCVMHMQGTPATMQLNPYYPKGVVMDVMEFFEERIKLLSSLGVKEEKIILDPGICFGKTTEDNVALLKNIPTLKTLGFPILIGLSRKSLMTRVLNKPANQLLHMTVALNALALQSGADIIRVHDVAEHRDLINFLKKTNWLTC